MGALQSVAVNVELASWSVIVVQTVTVESCFVVIVVAATVGGCGRVLTVMGILTLTHLFVLSQTVIQTESAPVKPDVGAYCTHNWLPVTEGVAMPCCAMPHTVAVKTEFASGSVMDIHTFTVESCLVTMGVATTVGLVPVSQ